MANDSGDHGVALLGGVSCRAAPLPHPRICLSSKACARTSGREAFSISKDCRWFALPLPTSTLVTSPILRIWSVRIEPCNFTLGIALFGLWEWILFEVALRKSLYSHLSPPWSPASYLDLALIWLALPHENGSLRPSLAARFMVMVRTGRGGMIPIRHRGMMR
jgi:hypothetical protein